MKKILIFVLLMSFNFISAKPDITELSKALDGNKIESIQETVIPDIYEVIIKGRVIYLSKDGKYAIQGNLIDLKTGDNLTEKRFNVARQTQIQQIPVDEMIIYKPKKTDHIVYIFTDIDCGYCRKLHSELQTYLDQGIEIRYLAFPRTGPNTKSSEKYDAVWCSKDKHSAMTEAKSGKAVASEKCSSPVAKQFNLGMEMGVNGTPAMILEDGELVPGYMPAKALRELLDETKKKTSQ